MRSRRTKDYKFVRIHSALRATSAMAARLADERSQISLRRPKRRKLSSCPLSALYKKMKINRILIVKCKTV